MTDTAIFKPICVLMVIVDRRRNQQLEQAFSELSLSHSLCCLAEGTANHEILDYLGLDITNKLVAATPVPWEEAPSIVSAVCTQLELNQPGKGIAFTVPVSGIAGSLALEILAK